MTTRRFLKVPLLLLALSNVLLVPVAAADETVPVQGILITEGPLPCIVINLGVIPPEITIIENCWGPEA